MAVNSRHMANRVYIYAVDSIEDGWNATGINEYKWITNVQLILMTGNPELVPSCIFKFDEESAAEIPSKRNPLHYEPVAIRADYDHGVARLAHVLAHAGRMAEREQALAFLTNPINRRRYLLMEPTEIFAQQQPTLARGPSPRERGRKIVRELKQLDVRLEHELAEYDRMIAEDPNSTGPTWGQASTIRACEGDSFGMYWSNILYYGPPKPPSGPWKFARARSAR